MFSLEYINARCDVMWWQKSLMVSLTAKKSVFVWDPDEPEKEDKRKEKPFWVAAWYGNKLPRPSGDNRWLPCSPFSVLFWKECDETVLRGLSQWLKLDFLFLNTLIPPHWSKGAVPPKLHVDCRFLKITLLISTEATISRWSHLAAPVWRKVAGEADSPGQNVTP